MAEDNGPRIIGEDDASISNRRQPKALLADVKKYAFIGGFSLLVLFGIYGSCHKPAPIQTTKATAPMAPQLPTVQSEEAATAETNRQIEQDRADTAARQQQLAGELRKNCKGGALAWDTTTHMPFCPDGINDQAKQHDPNAPGYEQSPEKTEAQKQVDERKQREYASLFASSVVPVSRVDAKLDSSIAGAQGKDSDEDKHDSLTQPTENKQAVPYTADGAQKADYDCNHPHGTMHCLAEGTIIEGALVNRLAGDFTGPVLVQVTTNVYDQSLQSLLIPQGAHFIGEATQVTGFGQQRLAIKFHRLVMPYDEATMTDGYSVSLDQFPGLSQEGETGLKDKVNSHYASIFGASLALGAIGGLAQIGNQGYGTGGYSPMTGFQNGVSESMAQNAGQVLDRFLKRLPSIEIRSGQRVDIFLTADLPLPEYGNRRTGEGI